MSKVVTYHANSLYDRTIKHGGGTFERNGANNARRDVTSGYSVAIVQGTYAKVNVNSRLEFNNAVHRIVAKYTVAQAIGTWVEGDIIHVDPIIVTDNREQADTLARANNQEAYYHLDTGETIYCK